MSVQENETSVFGAIEKLLELNNLEIPIDQNQIDTLLAEFQLQ
jgi:hypothetical protein